MEHTAIRGMHDVLPPASSQWQQLEDFLRRSLVEAGYGEIRTPLLEKTPLFARAIGAGTDIVDKEMYAFTDVLSGEALCLRPEGTAGVVRAAVEHQLLRQGINRLFYIGPMFRHERPQKGRYRQFHQLGVEVLGVAGPQVEVELILMLARLWQRWNLRLRLEINTLGDSAERHSWRAQLSAHWQAHAHLLSEAEAARALTNPLRLLDSKNPALAECIASAPRLSDHLGPASQQHFGAVCSALDALGISYTLNPRLVRGLDYYNRTVFEWVSDELGAQGTVAGGGRYDGLFEQLGAASTPACGFAMGLERLLLLLPTMAVTSPQVYVIWQPECLNHAFAVAEHLRQAGVALVLDLEANSFKNQMKRADASGAQWAVIVGEDETRVGQASLKALRHSQGQQQWPLPELVQEIQKKR